MQPRTGTNSLSWQRVSNPDPVQLFRILRPGQKVPDPQHFHSTLLCAYRTHLLGVAPVRHLFLFIGDLERVVCTHLCEFRLFSDF